MKKILYALLFSANVAYATNCPQNYFEGKEPIFLNNTTELCKDEFVIVYSNNKKTPILSSIHLTKDVVLRSADMVRKNNFTQDNTLPESLQTTIKDYTNSGYDKGHLTPFKDISFSNDVNKLSNVVPQAPSLNRGIWAQLEDNVRADAIKNDSIYVMTGVVFEEQVSIGSNVPVPSHMFKVIIYPTTKEKKVFIAENKKNAAIHKISIEELELISSISFPK